MPELAVCESCKIDMSRAYATTWTFTVFEASSRDEFHSREHLTLYHDDDRNVTLAIASPRAHPDWQALTQSMYGHARPLSMTDLFTMLSMRFIVEGYQYGDYPKSGLSTHKYRWVRHKYYTTLPELSEFMEIGRKEVAMGAAGCMLLDNKAIFATGFFKHQILDFNGYIIYVCYPMNIPIHTSLPWGRMMRIHQDIWDGYIYEEDWSPSDLFNLASELVLGKRIPPPCDIICRMVPRHDRIRSPDDIDVEVITRDLKAPVWLGPRVMDNRDFFFVYNEIECFTTRSRHFNETSPDARVNRVMALWNTATREYTQMTCIIPSTIAVPPRGFQHHIWFNDCIDL
jgi:hypothetical protein